MSHQLGAISRIQGNYLGAPPTSVRVTPFTGPRDTLAAMERVTLSPRGEQSMMVRQFTERVTQGIAPKDYLGEILAVRNVFVMPSPWKPDRPLFRYMNDPRHVEWIKDPQRMVEEIHQHGSTTIDCDEYAVLGATMCLQLGRECEFVAVGFAPGSLTHVGFRVKEPKSGQWIWMDPVAGPREREAAATAKEVMYWSLD